eukprot:CAMPEP_0182916536 /NCGR_PEP_ID=MMETSP0105_2-20130417/996_1 /TAXON_ID=81532 ORGANISM="Acanthoeca-like sp., Strain 10tr" /NCGR_SAMPLE_ID=MMETSP0105_2 /ASSEMBLY_ACC=CAM_ASM_000205 /LENGTH=448 /DNA_ID=CAMNT_0025053495 /DNA_START=36 /DNA_END=1382 /DNA_ORIENTATION=-
MLRSVAAVIALAAGATGQGTFTVVGGSTSMGLSQNWQGANPFDPSNLPTYTSFGNAGSRVVASIPSGRQLDIGMRIELQGQAAIILGNGGGGQNTGIVFRATGNRQQAATFGPPGSNNAVMSPAFNWNCNLNWLRNGQIPGRSPCSNDLVQFPNDGNTYYLSTYGQRAAARRIEVNGVSPALTQCDSSTAGQGYSMPVGNTAVVQLSNCARDFKFNQVGYTCPPPAVSMQCGPTVATGASVIASDQYTVITLGPFAGQVFTVDTATNRLINVTGTSGVTQVSPPTSTSPGSYRVGNTTFNGATGAAVADTPSPTPPSSASSGGDGGAGGGTVIIIIIILAVVIIAIAVFVVLKKKKGEVNGDGRNTGAVSFENPMYDDATANTNPLEVGATDGDGLYTEPAYADTGDTGGYMDVPAGHDDGGGYMEDDDGGGDMSGYMDVGPEDNDDV